MDGPAVQVINGFFTGRACLKEARVAGGINQAVVKAFEPPEDLVEPKKKVSS